MSKKRVEVNCIHNCNEEKASISSSLKAITEMGFSEYDLKRILNFYLFNAPIVPNNKPLTHGLKSLKCYGWVGNPMMHRLEGRLLSSSKMKHFCFVCSDSIEHTLTSMDLFGNTICTLHPRAVFKQNFKIKACEDGSLKLETKETRMECLFRHLRNSIAHGLT